MRDDAGLHDDVLEIGSSGGYEALLFLRGVQHLIRILLLEMDPSPIHEDPSVETSEAVMPGASSDPFPRLDLLGGPFCHFKVLLVLATLLVEPRATRGALRTWCSISACNLSPSCQVC